MRIEKVWVLLMFKEDGYMRAGRMNYLVVEGGMMPRMETIYGSGEI